MLLGALMKKILLGLFCVGAAVVIYFEPSGSIHVTVPAGKYHSSRKSEIARGSSRSYERGVYHKSVAKAPAAKKPLTQKPVAQLPWFAKGGGSQHQNQVRKFQIRVDPTPTQFQKESTLVTLKARALDMIQVIQSCLSFWGQNTG